MGIWQVFESLLKPSLTRSNNRYFYRLDSKYAYLKSDFIKFLRAIGYRDVAERNSLWLNKLDFIVQDELNNVVEAGEIKSYKETKGSINSWISYHRDNLRTLPNIDKLEKLEKGFVATIYGQLRKYSHDLDIDNLWLIQEGIEFKSAVRKSVKFLEKLNEISLLKECKVANLLCFKIRFKN